MSIDFLAFLLISTGEKEKETLIIVSVFFFIFYFLKKI